MSIKKHNMDTLLRYVHSMDTFTKEYSCIHQIPCGQIKNVLIKSQFMDTLQGRVHGIDMLRPLKKRQITLKLCK